MKQLVYSVYILCALTVCNQLWSAEDYYQQLGVSRSATREEIQKKYKKLAVANHPDRTKNDPEKKPDF